MSTVHFGAFVDDRRARLGFSYRTLAILSGYSERHLLLIRDRYADPGRLQLAKLSRLANALQYESVEDLDRAWKSTPIDRRARRKPGKKR